MEEENNVDLFGIFLEGGEYIGIWKCSGVKFVFSKSSGDFERSA